jgi:hypothetical protein
LIDLRFRDTCRIAVTGTVNKVPLGFTDFGVSEDSRTDFAEEEVFGFAWALADGSDVLLHEAVEEGAFTDIAFA